MKVGYARVSTAQQDLSNQIEQLEEAGCEKFFTGKQSGASAKNEAQIEEVVDFIREGDVLVVTRLDRLGRSLSSILNVVDRVHEKKASIKTIDGSLDTTSKSALSTAMVSLCGTFAQLERDLILQRTSEGRERARAAGQKMGRPPALNERDQKDVFKRLKNGESVRSVAKRYGVARATINGYMKKSKS